MKYVNLVLVALFLLVGCTADSITGVEDDASFAQEQQAVAAKKTVKMVPYKGVSYGSIVSQAPHPDCPGATVIKTTSEGTGRANHLGNFTWTGGHCFDYVKLVFYDGEITMVMPNGDELYQEYEGYMTSETTWNDTGTFVGGTGRFENATGWSDEKGEILEDGSWVISFEGMMSSVGSSK